MRLMVQRKTIDSDGPDEPVREPRSKLEWPLVVWVQDGPVCVTINDLPRPAHESSCRCGGCHAQAELAAQFLPD